MRERFDESTVLVALDLAQRAPSIHNSQPWLWRAAGDTLHLYADRDRQLKVADPSGRDMVISCGVALHHLRLAFAAAGWTGEVQRFPDPSEPDHLASIDLRPREPTARDRAPTAITERRTDRRGYSSWPVPDGMIARLVDEAAAEGVVLRRTSVVARDHLLAAIRDADRLHCADPAYTAELATWTSRPIGANDGIPAAVIPRDPSVYPGLRRFGAGELSSADDEEDEVDDAGVLLVAGTSSDDALSWLRVGEATSAVLLAATEYRLASAALTQAFNVPDARERVRTEVLHGGMVPQMIIRVGFAPLSAPPIPRTPRRSPNDTYLRVD